MLEEAVLQKGCWHISKYLLEDEDIRPAAQLQGSQKLLEVCAAREREARALARSEVFLVRGKGSDRRRPLIIMLHGNAQNAAIAGEDWNTATEAGHDIAFVQSSQITFHNAYIWTDLEQGVKDLKAAYDELKEKGELDGRDVILAGFSAGARLALHALLNGIVDARKAIFVGLGCPRTRIGSPGCRA